MSLSVTNALNCVKLRPYSCEAGWGFEFIPLKKSEVGSFTLLHKISWTACCFGIRSLLKQYNCYESATIWYTYHQYLAPYSEIINNLQEIPLMFCNYAVRSCGTWHKGPGYVISYSISVVFVLAGMWCGFPTKVLVNSRSCCYPSS